MVHIGTLWHTNEEPPLARVPAPPGSRINGTVDPNVPPGTGNSREAVESGDACTAVDRACWRRDLSWGCADAADAAGPSPKSQVSAGLS